MKRDTPTGVVLFDETGASPELEIAKFMDTTTTTTT
jgi:hypothetical protein